MEKTDAIVRESGSKPGGLRLTEVQWQLVMNYVPKVKYLASRLALRLPPHITEEDLIPSGIFGLIDAALKFNPAKHFQFKTYSEFRIKGAMLDELRNLDPASQKSRRSAQRIEETCAQLQITLGRPPDEEEIAHALGIDLNEYYKLLDAVKPIAFCELPEAWSKTSQFLDQQYFLDPFTVTRLHEFTERAIRSLPEQEKQVIALYYYEELTMKEIGKILGCVESRVSQLHTQAILRLRATCEKRDFL